MTKRKIEYWVIPPDQDAEFVADMENVLETYAEAYDPQQPVLCMDEQPVQLLKETRVPIPATRRHANRVDYEYERAGTANIFMFAEPLAGWREVTVRDTKTKVDWAVEMALLMERQLDRAGSAARGQIDPKHSGVIGIGAFHLGPGGLELLEAAARRVLDREGDRKQHIAAVVLFELSYQTTRVVDPAGTELQTTFTPVMRNVFVPHPRYRGGLQISQSRPWVPWPAPRSSP